MCDELLALDHPQWAAEAEAGRLWIMDGISDRLMFPVLRSLVELEDQPVEVYLSTDGGDGDTAVAICDALLRHKGPTTCYMTARVWSAGLLIAAGCSERLIAPGGEIMWHNLCAVACEMNAHELECRRERLDRFGRLCAARLASASQRGFEWWWDLTSDGRDHVFDADEALDIGIATGWWD